MKDINRPVVFFEKRKIQDDRLVEGGGKDAQPRWILSGDALEERSRTLSAAVKNISESFSNFKQNGKLPMVVSTVISDDAIAKSYRRDITRLYDKDGNYNCIGFDEGNQLLSVVEDPVVLDRIDERISDCTGNARLISSIDMIKLFEAKVSPWDSNVTQYYVELLNYMDYDINLAAYRNFEHSCEVSQIRIEKKTYYTSEILVYRVCISSMEEYEKLISIDGIQRIDPAIPVTMTVQGIDSVREFSSREAESGVEYPCAGILDTGVGRNAFMDSWVSDPSEILYEDDDLVRTHGSEVASVLEYPDELIDDVHSSCFGIRIVDAPVMPDGTRIYLFPDELVDNIKYFVETNPQVKIWNLSLGSDLPSPYDHFSREGIALDDLSDKYNVLFVKSAGNNASFMEGRPKERIHAMADSVRALTVGSLAHARSGDDYAEIGTPSPFTCVGPGPCNTVKPDLVSFGGNAGMRGNDPCYTGVPVIDENGEGDLQAGTSFAVPQVTRIAAELAFLMGGEFDPLLIKAMMIHNAEYPMNCNMTVQDKICQMGYGKPVSAADMLYNSENEITLIMRGTLRNGEYIEILDFPMPEMFDRDGNFRGQIIVTLIARNLLMDKNGSEYCQSDMSVKFGTYASEIERDTDKKTVRNPIGRDDSANVLSTALYGSKLASYGPQGKFRNEFTLQKYDKKYNPVKKYAVDLCEMTPGNRDRCLACHRKWYLQITGLYREAVSNSGVLYDKDDLSQDFCLLLTIRDPLKEHDVYQEVSSQLDVQNFQHYTLSINNEIINGV